MIMFKNNNKNYLYILIVYIIFSLIYLASEYATSSHEMGVPLDDTWIHFRFAENFASGHFYEYNLDEPTPGTTSPIWVILLSVPFFISKNLVIIYSLILTSLFFLLTCFAVYKLSLRIGFDKNYSMLITALTLLNGRLIWSSLSGMEMTLCCFLCVLVFLNHLKEIEFKKIYITTGILLGLCVVTRPECYLLALLYYLVTLFLLRKNLRSNIVNLSFSLLLFLIIIIPYPIFCYIHTGIFLPNTFKGQTAGFRIIPDYIYMRETARLFFKDNFLVMTLWLSGTVYFIITLIKKKIETRYLLINLWILLLPLSSVFIAPFYRHYGRYLIPLIPFINIVSINILQKFFEILKGKNNISLRKYPAVITSLLIFFSLTGAGYYGYLLGWNVENIKDQQIKIAHWINKNIPDEKVIAVNDIGALTYITDKKIVDMEGLVTPEILRIKEQSLENQPVNMMRELKKNNVNYIIIYPDWYKGIMKDYSANFEQLYTARLARNTICGDVEMFVYKINWDRINLNQ